MKHLDEMGAQLNKIGRCALVGILSGMLVGQAVAQGAPAATPQAPVQQATGAGNVQAPAANPANPAPSATDAASQAIALPDAPAAPTESASASMPADLKAMFDDASQESQNLQSAPATTKKGVQRPGMLVMGIAGVPLIVLGVMILSLKVGPKETGARDGLGAAFLAPGAAMSGLGFYFAFHKKAQ